ncbi:MAG TPA: HAD family hydrolase [Tepidisphaeraceae bacterium]|nr:HAD family hydrolase [Tepidisphaeraceae bacterium]
MLKAILFDLGDTLFDFAPMDTRAVFEEAGHKTYAFLEDRGHKLPPFRRYFRTQYSAVRWSYLWSKIRRREFNSFDLLGKICRRMNIELDDATLRELAWLWYSPITAYTSVAADVIPTLTQFRDRGYKLAIVSNTFIPGFVLDKHLSLHNLLEFFPTRIYSSEIGYRKPHPRIFEMALQAVGVSPADAIFVGDLVKTDIVGARRAGIPAILRQPFATSTQHRLADFVIRRISDLHQILPALGAPAADDLLPTEELAYES